MSEKTIRLAIDCMGGDHGLPVTLPARGTVPQQQTDSAWLRVGDQPSSEQQLRELPKHERDWYEIIHAEEIVDMDDSVEVALRRKKKSSMRLAAQAVKDKHADACISAGNTGAWVAISRYVLKTLDGISRPAIATSIPNQNGGATIMLDLGANVDCSAEHLLQFAMLGSALASIVDGHEQPTVGLLNIGEEVIKGNEVVKQAAELLRNSGLNFYGNVEGDDLCRGTVDVMVCDGFVGNVVLKSLEGLAKMVAKMLREEFTRDMLSMVAGAVAKPVLTRLSERVDNRQYNGAALLGLRGVVIKSHGSADVLAFGYALQRARDAVRSGLLEGTTRAIERIQDSLEKAQMSEQLPLAAGTDTTP